VQHLYFALWRYGYHGETRVLEGVTPLHFFGVTVGHLPTSPLEYLIELVIKKQIFHLGDDMPISYQRRREIWLEMAKEFPSPLDKKVSLRNIRKVAKLSSNQQNTLAQAVGAGLTRIPTALRYLETNPDATPQDLLRVSSRFSSPMGKNKTSKATKTENKKETESSMMSDDTPSQTPTMFQPNPEALDQLLGLLKTCYPDMNPYSARALAESEALSDILAVQIVYQQVFDSPHFNTDFVVVLFHNLLEQTREQLNQRISDNPAYQQALRQAQDATLRQAGIDTSNKQESV